MSKPSQYKAMARTIAKDSCLGISGGRRIGPSPTQLNHMTILIEHNKVSEVLNMSVTCSDPIQKVSSACVCL